MCHRSQISMSLSWLNPDAAHNVRVMVSLQVWEHEPPSPRPSAIRPALRSDFSINVTIELLFSAIRSCVSKMNLNIQFNSTRWLGPGIHMFGITAAAGRARRGRGKSTDILLRFYSPGLSVDFHIFTFIKQRRQLKVNCTGRALIKGS